MDWPDNFKDLYKKRGQHKRGIRLLALWKIQDGMSETDVCSFLGKTPNTIRTWRKTYEAEGLEGLLQIKPGRGRKPILNDTSLLEETLKKTEEELSGGRVRCQDIVDSLSQMHGIQYTRSGMYDALHRLGYSWITSRSKHPKHNEKEIEEFKKKIP